MDYNYDLEVILEENKIKSALSSMSKWFKDKIQLVKSKISKLNKKDIPNEKKGIVQKIKRTASGIISNCKSGISACKSGAADKAKACKDKVMDGLSNMSGLTKALAVGSGIAAVAIARNPSVRGSINGKIDGHRFNKSDEFNMNYDMTRSPRFVRNGSAKKKREYYGSYSKSFYKKTGFEV